MLLPPLGDPGPWKGQAGTLGAGITFKPPQADSVFLGVCVGGRLSGLSPSSLFHLYFFSCCPLPWRRGLIAAQTFNSHGNCNNNMGRGPSACDTLQLAELSYE